MKKITVVYLIIILSFFLNCYAKSKKLETTSGKPEVTIHGIEKGKIISKIINDMLDAKCELKSESEHNLVFIQKIKSIIASALTGSTLSDPERRIKYTIVDVENGVRIILTIYDVSNPGTDKEEMYDVSEKSKKEQEYLNEVKKFFEKI